MRVRFLYQEMMPHQLLQPFVHCYWVAVPQIRGESTLGEHRVLPDGCTDLILELSGTAPASLHAPCPVDTCRLEVVGPMTTSVLVPMSGETRIGVRFKPGGAAALFKVACVDLQNTAVDLDALWPVTVRGWLPRLVQASTLTARLRLIEAMLCERVASGGRVNQQVIDAVSQILSRSGHVSMKRLATDLGLSDRQLRRIFEQWVGVNPKLFARIVRFQKVIVCTQQQPGLDWASIASDVGYADQSHMIRDFHALSGLPPSAYFASR